MMRTIFITMCLFACAACGGSASNAPGASITTPGASPRYQIVLNRPFSAGERLRVVVDARQELAATHHDRDQERAKTAGFDKAISLSLAGVLTIREVDSDGRALSAELEVEHFKEGPQSLDVVAPDTKIDAVRNGDEFALKVNGKPRPDLQRFLRLAFPLEGPGSPLRDELFGTQEPKQIGDTWSFSKSKVAESLIQDGYAVRETNLTGETRLQGVGLVGGVECLRLRSKVHANRATTGEIPELRGAGTGTLDATIIMVVPVDTKLPLAMEEATTELGVDARVKDEGTTSKVGLTVTRYRKANYTPMP
jgi:hypothetical protein